MAKDEFVEIPRKLLKIFRQENGSNLPVLWRSISELSGAELTVRVKVNSRMLLSAGLVQTAQILAEKAVTRELAVRSAKFLNGLQ